MPISRLPRLVTGDKVADQWFDMIAAEVERALNVTATPPLLAYQSPTGNHLSWTGGFPFQLAKSGSGGIPARSSGDAPGKAEVTLYTCDRDNAPVSSGVTDQARNLGATAVEPNKWVILARVGRWWYVLWEDCADA